ncbi:MAG: hypothetical protein JJ863_12455 [Deltaproteobacteria bacterium]|nr:hypothetical protein [Deltaproteobacteria bacterium]
MTTRRTLLPIALLALCIGEPDGARAGDRELEILLVNMTPDPVSDEARACADRIRRVVRDGYTRVSQIGESALRRQVNDTSGEDFMAYAGERLQPVKQRESTWLDTVVLYDCRPNAQRADILIHPADGEPRRMRLRGVPIDGDLAAAMATRALAYGWIGFSP